MNYNYCKADFTCHAVGNTPFTRGCINCRYCNKNKIKPVQLNIINIKGKWYFVDDRLQEYRAVNNPHDVIPYE